MTQTTLSSGRVFSIDIMRGITLCLMLFVNDLFEPGVPSWMVHTKAETDGMGLADWVFPGFLFMAGLSIPYAMAARKKKGDTRFKLLLHVLFRSASLLSIGILMLNGSRVNEALTGMPGLLWKVLMYISVFLVWNTYPRKKELKPLFVALQFIGLAGLIYLVTIFKAGSAEDVKWLETGWWGILGLIGWGYLTAALVYLLIGDRLGLAVISWAVFVVLNILSQSGIVHIGGSANRIFGVVLNGNVPSIVLAGLTIGILVKKLQEQKNQLLKWLIVMGALSLVGGFILRNWFIISKIQGTPSWAMLCNGISILLFALVYYCTDILNKTKWAALFNIAGRNSLTTYLAPDLIYFACWGWGIPLFFYKQSENMTLAIGGSICWTVLMVLLAHVLSKIYIKLKL
ncbi:acyltransferase family protein [Niabella sp. CJ426]|uniref:acyltransferase family protein n=1 Tax=Niabella sp. CJ426 TaxID=3393740 RepID=UPI003D00AF2A